MMSDLGVVHFLPGGDEFEVLEQFGELNGRQSEVSHGIAARLLHRVVADTGQLLLLVECEDPTTDEGGWTRLYEVGENQLVEVPMPGQTILSMW